jgi:hypothetical protein
MNFVIAWAIRSIFVWKSDVDKLDKRTVSAVETVLLTVRGVSSLLFSLSSSDDSEFCWRWSWHHVKGHQDNTGGPLDDWAQLNIQMDSDAKKHWLNTHNSESSQEHKIWGEPWRVWTDKKVTSQLSRVLQDFCSSQPAAAYWRSKARVGEQFDLVDWDAIGGAMKRVPMNRRTWISKHVSGLRRVIICFDEKHGHLPSVHDARRTNLRNTYGHAREQEQHQFGQSH